MLRKPLPEQTAIEMVSLDGLVPKDHLLRKIALNFARANTTLKASLKGKRKSAAWDNDFMATLIAG